MKKYLVTIIALPLLLSACGDASNDEATSQAVGSAKDDVQPAQSKVADSSPENENSLGDEAKAWAEQTKKLGASAWESTKKAASDVAADGEGLLDKTKEAVGDTYEATKEKTGEVYDSVKEQGGELLESAKDKGSKLYESAKEKGSELLDKGQQDSPKAPAKPTEI